MKQTASKIIFGIFGIIIIAFVIYHATNSLISPYQTETVYELALEKKVTADCYIIRNENVIMSDREGYKVYSVANGSKVAKGAPVITYYNNENDVTVSKEINRLENIIASLTQIEKQNEIYAADLNAVAVKIRSSLYKILSGVEHNNLSTINDDVDELLYAMCQNQLATGREKNYSKVIYSCKAELEKLKSGFSPDTETVYGSEAGFFVNSSDGYENCFDYDKVTEITANDIENANKLKHDNKGVAKIITGYEWFIACVVEQKEIQGLSKGDKLKVNLPLSGISGLEVTVSAVNKQNSTDKAALILSCSSMNENLSVIRNQTVEIITGSYFGLRVNSEAVRVMDGEKGVFIKLGNLIKFRKTDIIYTSSEYVIVRSSNAAQQLKIYDDVIIKGKNLEKYYERKDSK